MSATVIKTNLGEDEIKFSTIIHNRDKSRLIINQNFCIYYQINQPNRWFRFWSWALLGWKWEDLT